MKKTNGAVAIEWVNIDSIFAYERNSRTHSRKQIEQIANSIQEFGFTNPILVGPDHKIIAGHGRLEAAKKLGIETIPIMKIDYLNEEQCRALVIADNQIALNAGWDEKMLCSELEEIKKAGFDFARFGFDEIIKEIKNDNLYTKKVEVPIYEPCLEDVSIDELFDEEKMNELCFEIESSDLPENEKEFLIIAATRHRVFNYAKIADYYSRASKKMQIFMEKSGLVIIDFDDAIASGYVKLTQDICELFDRDFCDE